MRAPVNGNNVGKSRQLETSKYKKFDLIASLYIFSEVAYYMLTTDQKITSGNACLNLADRFRS